MYVCEVAMSVAHVRGMVHAVHSSGDDCVFDLVGGNPFRQHGGVVCSGTRRPSDFGYRVGICGFG